MTSGDVGAVLDSLAGGGADAFGGLLDLARRLCGAAYAALSLSGDAPGEVATIEHFYVTGVHGTVDMGPPQGQGVLAGLLAGSPVRTSDVRSHPLFGGFPAGHPEIGPMLGIPIEDTRRTVGILFVARPPGGAPFTDGEEVFLRLLGAAAVPGLRRLTGAAREAVAGLCARATRLLCEELLADMESGRPEVAARAVRGYLASESTDPAPLSRRLHRAFDVYSRDSPVASELRSTGDVDTALTCPEEELLVAVVRGAFHEALRIPGARHVRVTIDAGHHGVTAQIRVRDVSPPPGGLGPTLKGLAEEAEHLGGSLRLSQGGDPYRIIATFPGRRRVHRADAAPGAVALREHVYGSIVT